MRLRECAGSPEPLLFANETMRESEMEEVEHEEKYLKIAKKESSPENVLIHYTRNEILLLDLMVVDACTEQVFGPETNLTSVQLHPPWHLDDIYTSLNIYRKPLV